MQDQHRGIAALALHRFHNCPLFTFWQHGFIKAVVSVQVGELAEIFQWRGDAACSCGLPGFSASDRQHVGECCLGMPHAYASMREGYGTATGSLGFKNTS